MTRPNRLLFALPLLLAGGCVDNPVTLEVLQNTIPDPPACQPATMGTGPSASAGIFDVGIAQGGAGEFKGYEVYPVVRNNLEDPSMATGIVSGMGGVVQTQRDDIELVGVDVQLTVTGAFDAAVRADQRSFYQNAYGGIVPAAGTGALTVEVVPLPIAVELNAALQDGQTLPMVARFRVVGQKTDSSMIESGWVDFPINVCRWCLTGGKPPPCPKDGVLAASVLPGACNVPQDDPVTCCTDTKNRLLCGSTVPTKTM